MQIRLCVLLCALLFMLGGCISSDNRNVYNAERFREVLARIESESGVYESCARSELECPSTGAAAWQAMLQNIVGHAPLDQIKEVNRFFNTRKYKDDLKNYGVSDYWATPLEFLNRSGDCEDYVMAKYVSLRLLGFPLEHLHVLIGDDIRPSSPLHATLGVYRDGNIYVLDNRTYAVLPYEKVVFFQPLFSMNERMRPNHVPHCYSGPFCTPPH